MHILNLILRISDCLLNYSPTEQEEDGDEERLYKLAAFQKTMLKHAMTCELQRSSLSLESGVMMFSSQCHKDRVLDVQRACH